MEHQPTSLDFSGKCLVDGLRHRRIVAAVKKELTALSVGHHEGDRSRSDAVNDQALVPAPHAREFGEDGGLPREPPSPTEAGAPCRLK